MSRELIVAVHLLSETDRKRIEEKAEELGFTTHFCETEEEAARYADSAEIIFAGFSGLVKIAPNLRWYCTPFAGVDDFTNEEITGENFFFASPDAVLTNSSGAYGLTISEHAVMVTLELLRKAPVYADHIAKREWVRKLPTRSIYKSGVMLLGTGNIGRETAKRFRGFSPERIIGVNRSGRMPDGNEKSGDLFDRVVAADQMDEFLPGTDILVMSLPGTEESSRVLDARRLAMLPDGCVIVNVGRGTCIETEALERELRSGRLLAALDVFETEPLPPDSPLWDCPNLLITPHIAGDLTLDHTRALVVGMFLENLERYCTGQQMFRIIDLKKGY